MLQGKEIREESGLDPTQLQRRIDVAHSRGHWAEVLALMRQKHFAPSQDKVALLRSLAYEHLGHIETALVFMQHAATLNPSREDYAVGILALMRRLGKDDEAKQHIDSLLQRECLSAAVKIYCANELFVLAGAEPLNSTSEGRIRAALELLEEIRSALITQEALLPPLFAVTGLLTLGACYERLGDMSRAEMVYSDALDVDPADAETLVLRGLLRARMGHAGAISDLEDAISLGTSEISPYLVVAHRALAEGKYHQCITICDRAYRRTRDTATRAALLQWKAIAQCKAGYPMSAVVRNAQRAADLDPLNLALQDTLSTFLALAEAGQTTPAPPPQDVFALDESRPDPCKLLPALAGV
jgi:tetratricopeptide (TPR) repeat protein